MIALILIMLTTTSLSDVPYFGKSSLSQIVFCPGSVSGTLSPWGKWQLQFVLALDFLFTSLFRGGEGRS